MPDADTLVLPRPQFALTENRYAGHTGRGSGSFDPSVGTTAALGEIRSWPGYHPTPLCDLAPLAASLGVARVWYKDEGRRFEVMSFKPLGAGYAVARIVARELARLTRKHVTGGDVSSGRFRELASRITVACATDGNHGRAVAWSAQAFGCHAVVFLASHVSRGREHAIALYGAEVVRTSGNHDDAVREVAAEAARRGWHVVSETTNASQADIAHDILVGYSTLLEEAADQWPTDEPPTHLFVQAGVGGLAAACAAYAERRWGPHRPVLVVVEPETAASAFMSVQAGERVSISGHFETVMAGLAAGEVSEYAWPFLRDGIDYFMTIGDDGAVDTMRLLARQQPPIVAGESGVAGLVGALALAQDPEARQQIGLTAASRILTVGTEGATDAEIYERLVGMKPA